MQALKRRMRALERSGLTRKQIGLTCDVAPAYVTRALGARRRWLDRRKEPAPPAKPTTAQVKSKTSA